MEIQPDTTNTVYLDEYPHLTEKIRLRRLARGIGNTATTIIYLPTFDQPEDIA